MIEELNYTNLNGMEVILHWEGSWYRLPMYLLEDIADQWADHGRWTDSELLLKCADWENVKNYEHDRVIKELKEILKHEMQYMEAYKMHEVV